MTTKTELGKITAARVGFGGRDDGWFGITFHLESGGFGAVTDFWPLRNPNVVDNLTRLMKEASVKNASDLEATPIEVTYDGDRMDSWRILTEVL